MTILFTEPSFVPVSGNSVVYPGAKLYFYATETSTPQNTYSEYTLTTAHANPVVADADGRFAPIYLDPNLEDYKVVLKDSSDVTIWTVDPYSAVNNTTNLGTISDLLASSTALGTVSVNGYHTAGDGGGGEFYWDATQDKANHNGGTIIDPDITFPSDWTNATQVTTWFTAGTGTGCWMLIYKTGVSVKQFGAKGDASTDDTKMFQAAVDSGVKRVEVPPAIYHVTSINLSDTRGLTLIGTGNGELGQTDGTAVLKLIANASMLVCQGTGSVTRLGLTIKNIHFDGDAINRTSGTFLDVLLEARRIYVEKCYVVSFRSYGVKVVNAGGVFIRHCDIFNCGYNLYGSTWSDSGVIGGQTGSGAGGGAPWVVENIFLTGAGGNCHFTNHRPNFSSATGVRISGDVTRVGFHGGLCDQNQGGGFILEGNCTAIKITGMDIFDNGTTTTNKPAIQITSTQGALGFQDPAGIQIIGNNIFDRNIGTANETQDVGIDASTLSKTSLSRVAIVGNGMEALTTPLKTLAGVRHSAAQIANNKGLKTEITGITTSTIAIDSTGVKTIASIDASELSEDLHSDTIVQLSFAVQTQTDFDGSIFATNSSGGPTLSGTTFDARANITTASATGAATSKIAYKVIN